MLTIGKAPAFGPDQMAVSGQYDPEMPGWTLRWFHRGAETVLYTGTLPVCCRLMGDCRGFSLDEMRRLVMARQQGETAEFPAPHAGAAATEDFPSGVADEPPSPAPKPSPPSRRRRKKKGD